MKPFDRNAKCPKCGGEPKSPVFRDAGADGEPSEHLSLCCPCGYSWVVACLDASMTGNQGDTVEKRLADTLRSVARSLDSMIEDNPKIDPYMKLVRDHVGEIIKKHDEGMLVVDVPRRCQKCGDMDIPNHLCRNADPLALSGGTSKMRTGGNLRLEGTSTDRRICQVCGESSSPLTLMNDGYWRCYKCVASSVSRTEEGFGQAGGSKTKESPSALIKSRGVCVKCGNKEVDLYLIINGVWTCMDCGSVYADSKGGGVPLPFLSGSLKDWMRAIGNARLHMREQCVAACKKLLKEWERIETGDSRMRAFAVMDCIKDIEKINL